MKTVRNIYSKVIWAWRDSRHIQKIAGDLIAQKSDHFRAGIWKIRWRKAKAFLVRNSKEAADFYRAFCRNTDETAKVRIRDRLMDLLSAGWKYRAPDDPSPVFTADCVIISISGSPLFFDLQKMILKRDQEKGVRGYCRLKEAGYWEHFQTPVLSIEDGASYEKVLRSRKRLTEKEEEEQFQDILRKYGEYFDAALPAERRTVAELTAPYRSWISEFDRIFPPSILKLPLNCYMQHGDNKKDNLICDCSGNMYVIDYESASVQPFVYDILYFASNRVGMGLDDWRLLDGLMDPSTKTGRLFDELLIRQGIPANKAVKLALLVLTRLIMPTLADGLNSSVRDMKSMFMLREQNNVKRIAAHYMGDETQSDI